MGTLEKMKQALIMDCTLFLLQKINWVGLSVTPDERSYFDFTDPGVSAFLEHKIFKATITETISPKQIHCIMIIVNHFSLLLAKLLP